MQQDVYGVLSYWFQDLAYCSLERVLYLNFGHGLECILIRDKVLVRFYFLDVPKFEFLIMGL